MRPSWDQELFRTPGPEFPVARLRSFEGFWGPVWGPKLVHFLLFLGSCFGRVFGHFLEHFWTNFGDPFWEQMGLRWAKMGSKRPIKRFKVTKTCICKNLKNIRFLMLFGLPRPSNTALGGPRRLPRGSYRAPKALKKWTQKWNPF